MSLESTLTKLPENSNLLQAVRYTFIIPELPFAKYFCQKVDVPGVSTNAVNVPTPFSATKRHGDTLLWSDFTLTALVDEDLRVWEETLDWLVSLTKPTKFSQYHKRKGKEYELYYDGILTLNTNSNIPNLRIKFHDCHPVAIGGLNFDTTVTAEQTITTDITFAYDFYEIERLT